jgi:DNA-directed RNA polymerase specialized sigma24 family protein
VSFENNFPGSTPLTRAISINSLRLHLYAKSAVVLNEEAFLIHAVRNLAIDRHRHDRSMEGRQVQIDDVDRQYPLIAQSQPPDQILDSQQRSLKLTALLDAVNPRTRETFFARRSGYTCAEMASDMGIAGE